MWSIFPRTPRHARRQRRDVEDVAEHLGVREVVGAKPVDGRRSPAGPAASTVPPCATATKVFEHAPRAGARLEPPGLGPASRRTASSRPRRARPTAAPRGPGSRAATRTRPDVVGHARSAAARPAGSDAGDGAASPGLRRVHEIEVSSARVGEGGAQARRAGRAEDLARDAGVGQTAGRVEHAGREATDRGQSGRAAETGGASSAGGRRVRGSALASSAASAVEPARAQRQQRGEPVQACPRASGLPSCSARSASTPTSSSPTVSVPAARGASPSPVPPRTRARPATEQRPRAAARGAGAGARVRSRCETTGSRNAPLRRNSTGTSLTGVPASAGRPMCPRPRGLAPHARLDVRRRRRTRRRVRRCERCRWRLHGESRAVPCATQSRPSTPPVSAASR